MSSCLRPPLAFLKIQSRPPHTHVSIMPPTFRVVFALLSWPILTQLKSIISLVILNPVKLTIKINHNEKTEVAILWTCAPGDTAISTVHHY